MYFESHFQTFQSVMVRRMWQSREVLFAAARGNREEEGPEGRAQGTLELSSSSSLSSLQCTGPCQSPRCPQSVLHIALKPSTWLLL